MVSSILFISLGTSPTFEVLIAETSSSRVDRDDDLIFSQSKDFTVLANVAETWILYPQLGMISLKM